MSSGSHIANFYGKQLALRENLKLIPTFPSHHTPRDEVIGRIWDCPCNPFRERDGLGLEISSSQVMKKAL